MYPDKTPKERENAITKEHRTVFIMQIGDLLSNGEKHDGRSPDYDDWKLNGDILFYDDVLDCAMEISSMGIRVDAKSMDEQLTKAGCDDRRQLSFHKMLVLLPYCLDVVFFLFLHHWLLRSIFCLLLVFLFYMFLLLDAGIL